MKTIRKIDKRFNARQRDYQETIKRLNEVQKKGYRCPGSRNPKKAGG